MAAFPLQQQSWVMTETTWPAKPKTFTGWPSAGKVCQPLVQSLRGETDSLVSWPEI